MHLEVGVSLQQCFGFHRFLQLSLAAPTGVAKEHLRLTR
jgi:hypothetical protein